MFLRAIALAALPAALSLQLWGQFGQVLTVTPPVRAAGARNASFTAAVTVQLRNGYHVNSHTPDEDYLIPLMLTWDPSPLEVKEVVYPKAEKASFSFSTKPVSVYTGTFDIVTRFNVPAKAPVGALVLNGRLRYQACNDTMCLPPKTVEVKVPVEIRAQ